MPAELDVILFGATGYTGQLVAAHFARVRRERRWLRWGLAGRDIGRLRTLANTLLLPPETPLFEADAADPGALEALVAQTRSVVSTVGPYQLHGSGLVAACAAAGVDYLDLCGEPAWMRRMVDRHHLEAERSGARILFSCGFDSIPFEAGVYALQAAALAASGRPFRRISARVTKLRGGLSGGTAASLKATHEAARDDADAVAQLRNPFLLTPGFAGTSQPDDETPRFDDTVDAWVGPFVMAPINRCNVHRSNLLLAHRYGEDFRYDEMMATGSGEKGRSRAEALVGLGRTIAVAPLPATGDGPSTTERASGAYDITFIGREGPGPERRLRVSGDLDPGYGATARMIAETSACLLQVGEAAPGGVRTPVATLGSVLIDHLRLNAAMNFEPLAEMAPAS